MKESLVSVVKNFLEKFETGEGLANMPTEGYNKFLTEAFIAVSPLRTLLENSRNLELMKDHPLVKDIPHPKTTNEAYKYLLERAIPALQALLDEINTNPMPEEK